MPSEVYNLIFPSRIKVHLGLTGKSFEIRHYSYNLPLWAIRSIIRDAPIMNRIERDKYIAWVGMTYSDTQIWGQYERLVDFVFDEYPKTKRRFDEISLPVLFIISHAIELALKENIDFYQRYHGNNHFTKFKNFVLQKKSHDLKSLADEFKIGFKRLHKKVKADKVHLDEFSKYYIDLEKLISILDRSTETFRYANKIDNQGNFIKKSIDGKKTIDLLELKELFDKVKTLFIGAPNSLGIYTNYIDFKKGNPKYKKGKGYLYCQRLHYTESFLEDVKEKMNEQLTLIEENTWLDSKSGENFEIQVWNNDIYIIAI